MSRCRGPLIVMSGLAAKGLAVGGQITVTFPPAATHRITVDEVAGVTVPAEHSASGGTAGVFTSGGTSPTSRGGEFVSGRGRLGP